MSKSVRLISGVLLILAGIFFKTLMATIGTSGFLIDFLAIGSVAGGVLLIFRKKKPK